jgi:hypothetical protein
MRFTFVILLFCGLGADAQMIIKAHPNYVPFASANLLLDQYSGAAGAYSLRKLRTAYIGSAIRVRRSNDNTEQDIGFTAGGDLDTASLKTFVGANSGFVTTWYSQGDSTSADFTQATAASQPIIINAGVIERQNGDPTIRFDRTSSDFMQVASSTSKFAFLHTSGKKYISIVCRAGVGVNPNAQYTILSTASNNTNLRGINILYRDETSLSNNDRFTLLIANVNATLSVVNINQNNFFTANQLNLLSIDLDPGNATADQRGIVYYNSTTTLQNNTSTLTPSTSPSSANLTIGRRAAVDGTEHLNGYISEIIIYNSDQSSNRTGIETNINSYYGIY